MDRRQILKAMLATSVLLPSSLVSAKPQKFDAIVVGAGVFGMWSAWYLNQAGLSVAIIDQASPGHSASSSGGESRVTRTGYGDVELYAEWSYRSLVAWKELSEQSKLPLFHPIGMVLVHQADDKYAKDGKKVLNKLGIPFESIDTKGMRDRYPVMKIKDGELGMLEPHAGGLMARRGVQTLAIKANQAGVHFFQSKISPISANSGTNGRLTEVECIQGSRVQSIQSENFIFACGPWLDRVCPEAMAKKLFVTRQEILYFQANRELTGNLPSWATLPYYGLPDIEGRGFKVANDTHGELVNPNSLNRNISAETIAQTRAFLAERFPSIANQPLLESRVCQYENSANGDFVIDLHPGLNNAYVVGGGSGHGFKHGPAVGQYVTDRVLQRGTLIKRFSLESKATVQHRQVV
ncbi:FAD-dependent oxidoreductase [Aliiglaciecola litoralis]|uniref:N-methyl-L-tryptophan oxidase n=1 Tax=Aliiglaciecola litoralis TaxID=582857 RepID=A0ABN1LG49_9ALTE